MWIPTAVYEVLFYVSKKELFPEINRIIVLMLLLIALAHLVCDVGMGSWVLLKNIS